MKSPHLYYIAALLVLGFLLVQKPAKEYIKVPAEKGSFEPQEPIYIRDTVKVYVTQWKTKTDTIEVKTPNPINEELAQKYQEAESTIEQYEIFINSIQIKPFKNTFEDQQLRVSVSGKVQGELLKINVEDYLIKEREIEKKGLGINISLSAGYGMTNTGLSPIVGLTISKPILRL